MVNLKTICEDFKSLEGLPLTVLILGGCHQQLTWKGSAKTLSGLPLPYVDPGGGFKQQSPWKGCV